MRTLIAMLLSVAGLCCVSLKAGVGRIDITPAGPIWMSGYAARTHASDVALMPLWAKALAIESGPGRRIVIVTTDVVGVPRVVEDEAAARVESCTGSSGPSFSSMQAIPTRARWSGRISRT